MAELTQAIGELKTLLGQTETEVNALLSGKKAAAPRVRASLQKIKGLSHSMRGIVMNYTKALPVKPRTKKEELQINCPTHAAVMAEESAEPQTPAPPSPVKKQRKRVSKPKPC